MKNTKRWINTFDFYDKHSLAAYFEAQARKGWLLEDFSGFSFLFRRNEPRNLHYSVVYYPEKTVFHTELTETQETFCEYCAHSGWQLVTSRGYLQVFCNELEDPVPIQTEPKIELENIHNYYKSNQNANKTMYILNSLMIVWAVSSLISGGLDIADRYDLMTAVFWSALLLVSLMEILSYRMWYRKAKQSVSFGKELPRVKSNRLRLIIQYLLVIAALLGLLAEIAFQESMQTMIGIFLVMAFLVLSCFALVKLLQGKRFADHGGNAKAGMFALLASTVAVVVMGIIIGMAMS